MSKAKRRRDAEPAPASGTAEYYRDVVDRQMAMIRAYKIRQDDVVLALNSIEKMLKLGAADAASTAMADLMARDLRQAQERHDNRAIALQAAISLLENYAQQEDRKAIDVLSQIELLDPDLLTVSAAPAGAIA